MRRRQFVSACALGACSAGLLPACRDPSTNTGPDTGPLTLREHARVRLVDGDGEPIRASALPVAANGVFHYPHVSTPAFLFRLAGPVAPTGGLADRDGRPYSALPGVGPGSDIVAFCAICVHKLSHPSPQLTYISLRERLPGEPGASPHVISCCAQNSRFDPYHGARVLDGPADQPLAGIRLEHDPVEDTLHATGLLGGEVFERYFETFARRLAHDHGSAEDAREPSSGDVRLHWLDDYSGNVLRC